MTTQVKITVLSVFILVVLFITASLGAGWSTEYVRRNMEAAAEHGNADAQYELGVMYYTGEGVAKDPAEAAKWYRKAAEQGNDEAQYRLGLMYANGEGLTRDCVEAKKWWTKAAKQGNARAQGLSVMFRGREDGSLANFDLAAEGVAHIRKEAEQGDVTAQYGLGWMYDQGIFLTKDSAEAAKWYRKAADQGHAGAQCFLGRMAEDPTEAVKWYTKAAEQGDAGAQSVLAMMYAYGVGGVAKDPTEAVKWYTKAAEQGDALKQYLLGSKYANGEGVAKDPAEAAKWYRKAAEQGYADAQFSLGVMYDTGEGIAKDRVEAAKWYRKAAEQGDADAQFRLGVMYDTGEGVAKDRAEAVKWYRMAAEQGQADAQFNLAAMYANGEGLLQSRSAAVEWYYKAGQSYVRGWRKEDALTCYDRIRSLAPDSHLAPKLYADIYQGTEGAAQGGSEAVARPDEKEQATSSGTGWVAEAGFIVTNNHVVSGRTRLTVRFADGKEAKATAAVADAANDLALLRADDGVTLPLALPLAKGTVETGESVFTVGYPHPDLMGAEAKVSEGIVSGNTGIGGDVRTLQISVPVQAGNSGGPLINMKGEVVGIVVAKLNAIAVFAWTGDLTENVNYAVKTGYLKALFESAPKGNPTAGTGKAAEAALPELAARVKQSVVLIVAQ